MGLDGFFFLPRSDGVSVFCSIFTFVVLDFFFLQIGFAWENKYDLEVYPVCVGV